MYDKTAVLVKFLPYFFQLHQLLGTVFHQLLKYDADGERRWVSLHADLITLGFSHRSPALSGQLVHDQGQGNQRSAVVLQSSLGCVSVLEFHARIGVLRCASIPTIVVGRNTYTRKEGESSSAVVLSLSWVNEKEPANTTICGQPRVVQTAHHTVTTHIFTSSIHSMICKRWRQTKERSSTRDLKTLSRKSTNERPSKTNTNQTGVFALDALVFRQNFVDNLTARGLFLEEC